MNRISSKQAKAHAITGEVKRIVFHRDGGLCVYCKRAGSPEAHYIPRSKGGLGIEENILTLCRECHDKFDRKIPIPAKEREGMKEFFQDYLKSHYPDWDESKLIYRKGML